MRVHHIALRTHDLVRLERFYVHVLGLAVKRRNAERSVWLAAGDTILMLERAEPNEPKIPEGSQEFFAFAISPEQKLTFRETLTTAGITLEHETSTTIYFRDPDGRRVGLSHFTE